MKTTTAKQTTTTSPTKKPGGPTRSRRYHDPALNPGSIVSGGRPVSLDAIFKAYDIRGLYPDEIDEAIARLVGNAFARFTGAARVLVARDMRPSSVPLSEAFAEGVNLAGADVTHLGLASTDLAYFASGRLDAPAAMFTASHNPAQYNGIKLCRAGAAPVGEETGLRQIRATVESGVVERAEIAGRVESLDMLEEFAAHVRSFVDPSVLRPLRVVADTANGMGGLVVPACSTGCPSICGSSTASSTAPSRTTPPTRSSPRTSKTCSARCSTRAPMSVSPSTAMPIASSSSTTRVSRCRARRRRRSSPRASSPATPARRSCTTSSARRPSRGHPRERRRAGAHPRRSLVHQAGDGRDRSHLRRRALGALLLPRQLAGRLGLDRGRHGARAVEPGRRAALGAAQAVRALRPSRARSTRASTTPPR